MARRTADHSTAAGDGENQVIREFRRRKGKKGERQARSMADKIQAGCRLLLLVSLRFFSTGTTAIGREIYLGMRGWLGIWALHRRRRKLGRRAATHLFQNA